MSGKKKIVVSAILAFILTSLLLTAEYLSDKPTPAYTTEQYVTEIVLGLLFFTSCFGVFIYAAIRGVGQLSKVKGGDV